MTRVQVSADEVMDIAVMGLNTIAGKRAANLESELVAKLKETTAPFLFEVFGTKPRYRNSFEALAALKEPGPYFGVSKYLWATRYYLRDDEHRLVLLSNMAQSSIDATLWVNESDHSLLRKYASGFVWLANTAKK